MKRMTAILLGFGLAAPAWAQSQDLQRLQAAGQVIDEIMQAPDKGIPSGLLQKAHCVIVIPSMKKGGFVFSGKYGRGFAVCRKSGGGWTDPAGMRIEGGGFGLQAGGSAVDLVLLVMSKKGKDGLLASKFTLGAEASVAAGPVGRQTTAQTDATMRADILSWSRSRGVFGGLSLQGGTLRPDDGANQGLYGEKVSSKDILTGTMDKPLTPDLFVEKVEQHGGRRGTK